MVFLPEFSVCVTKMIHCSILGRKRKKSKACLEYNMERRNVLR